MKEERSGHGTHRRMLRERIHNSNNRAITIIVAQPEHCNGIYLYYARQMRQLCLSTSNYGNEKGTGYRAIRVGSN
ncbi:hypothetical protein E2C01_083506 [Portunus trituberculatus]|uniref:Uncharacterized protein n=1 Tax=Portunus trituberculatus TaxID=210409 RepID=A0A5B7ISM4_PORTR|nr:hypothetical protein [Portunus trituberculatus]